MKGEMLNETYVDVPALSKAAIEAIVAFTVSVLIAAADCFLKDKEER